MSRNSRWRVGSAQSVGARRKQCSVVGRGVEARRRRRLGMITSLLLVGSMMAATAPVVAAPDEPTASTSPSADSTIGDPHGESTTTTTEASTTTTTVAADEETTPPDDATSTTEPVTSTTEPATEDVDPDPPADAEPLLEPEPVPTPSDEDSIVPFALAGPPVFEIEGHWVSPPPEIATGDPVVAQWYVNVNDSDDPPGNDPVDNVTATFVVGNGRFAGIPDACLTVGVAPVSEISPDGLTLTCNFGTVNAGTAVAVQTPVTADGPTGSELSISGSIAGLTVTPPPIPIFNTFGMDIAWQTSTNFRAYGADYIDVDLEWTLFLQKGGEAGPNSVTYELTVTDGLAAGVTVGPNACSAFTDRPASGHPWSGGAHPANQMAPFVGSCTLSHVAGDTFELTLTGIDYSLAQVPTHDSVNQLLPADQVAIASGSVWFRIASTANNSITLISDTPTYTSVSGATAVDDPDNNRSDKTITLGGWSNAWRPEAMGIPAGSWWSNQIYVSPGYRVAMINTDSLGQEDRAPTDIVSRCIILDPRWVTYESMYLWNTWGGPPVPDATIEYYVGGHATVDPASAGYDPNAFTCATDPGGWTTTEPGDLSTVKAVRASYPFASVAGWPVTVMNVWATVNDDAPIGQDIWQFGERAINGDWLRPSRTLNPTDGSGPRTPGMRYPYIGSGRDVLYVIGATPAIEKSADRPTVRPGEPATFTLTYSANGAGAIPPTVDGFEIVDTLPVGMEYVDGSATPPPSTVEIDVDGRYVLRWVLDDVPTNTLQTVTYQAEPIPGIAGGTQLTNSAVASYDDRSTTPATATVTTTTNGYTTILKMATDEQVQVTDDSGTVTLPWTVTISSFDPEPQTFTDTIDILPYNGDDRGTSFNGDYAVGAVVLPDGGTVYYTTADPATLSDDPADTSNGVAGDPTGNTVGWTTTPPVDMSDVTAIRVIGPELVPGTTFEFELVLETSGAEPGDVYVNRAQARAENTVLVMRTSAMIELYQDVLVKELDSLVRNADGTFDAVFTISTSRTGNGPGYHLSDILQYGDGVTLNGDPVAANVDPGDGSITLVNTYDPPTATLTIAEDVAIDDGVTHVYTVTSNVSIDGTTIAFGSTDCTLEGTETGTGLLNTATLTVDDIELDAAACAELPYTVHEKNLTSGPTPNGDGTYTVGYTIDVHNLGAGDDSYDLDDDFRFGDSITIEGTPTVSNTVPGGIATLGTWNPAATTLAIVAGQPIDGGTPDGPTTHTYVVSVVVSVDADTVTFEDTDCDMDAGETGTGLFNATTLAVGDHVENDDDCAPISEPRHVKTVSDGPTPIGAGRYEVEYTIEVANAGAAAGVYDLVDDFRFGVSVTIEGTPTVVNTVPGTIATLGTWDPGTTTLAIVDDEPIAAGTPGGAEVHAYVVTVQVSVDAETVTFENTDCGLGAAESGTGLFNTATMTVHGADTDRDACVPISEPAHTKTITAGPELLDNGNYAVEYTIEVTNAGAAASTYDLVDDFRFTDAVTIEGTPTVINTAPGTIATPGTWDPVATTLAIVTDQPIAVGAAGAPTLHTYVVAVEVSLDHALVTLENSDCELGDDDGTGLFNTATMTVNEEETDVDTCRPFPEPETTFDKSLVSVSPNGDGTYTVVYTLTVGRNGVGVPYTLTDTLRYGAGATISAVAITGTTPGGLPVNGGWNGSGDDIVAADVPIGSGDTHLYEVTVRAGVDEPAVPAGASDCEIGDAEDGTGFTNTASVTSGDVYLEDDGCAPFPVITLEKQFVSGPSDLANGQHAATYTITVTNSGEGDGEYDLTDTLMYGAGVEIVDATIANTTPGGIAANGGWNGMSDTGVVTGEPIAAGATHVYTVTVNVIVADDLTEAQADCTLAPGESGTGLLNTAEVNSNGGTADDQACGMVPPASSPPTTAPPAPGGNLPRTGIDTALILGIGGMMVLAGAVTLLGARRRRRPAPTLGATGTVWWSRFATGPPRRPPTVTLWNVRK